MKKIIAFNGSPRKTGNTYHLLSRFLDGAQKNDAFTEQIHVHDCNLKYCTGCLRCNLIKRCSIQDDDWGSISSKILTSDVVVFASPVYFHHVSASLKKLIDRFRSFVHIQITESGLIHTPHQVWSKDFVLILSMGSSDASDAKPATDLFQFITSILGSENRLHVLTATRLAVVNQIIKTEEELKVLYTKMNIPLHLVKEDYAKNQSLLAHCYQLGRKLSDQLHKNH